MFVYNVKINGSKSFKLIFFIMVLILLCILGLVMFRIFKGPETSESTCLPNSDICKISASNYTNVLKAVHENIDDYVGTKINFTGYVYRVSNLKENQFILARDMLISSNFQSVIVGFLCECDKAKDFANDTWIEITGEIYKGEYNGPMPIVKITNIKQTNRPNNEYVYPPDDSYIPTSQIV